MQNFWRGNPEILARNGGWMADGVRSVLLPFYLADAKGGFSVTCFQRLHTLLVYQCQVGFNKKGNSTRKILKSACFSPCQTFPLLLSLPFLPTLHFILRPNCVWPFPPLRTPPSACYLPVALPLFSL
jgi:hypothetical protein